MPDYRGVDRATLIAGALDSKFLALGGDRVIAIPDSGHDVLLEQPAALATVIDQLNSSRR
jgi:pimeloyl-ACP methyl ester carboxylesterase